MDKENTIKQQFNINNSVQNFKQRRNNVERYSLKWPSSKRSGRWESRVLKGKTG